MNVLLVNYLRHDQGGAGVATLRLARILAAGGHNVVVASRAEYPGFKSYIFKDFRFLPVFALRDRYLSIFLRKIAVNEDIDAIHSSECRFTSRAAIMAAKALNLKSIQHFRGLWFVCLKGDMLYRNKSFCSGPNPIKCLWCQKKYRMPWELYKYWYFKKRQRYLKQANVNIAINQTYYRLLTRLGISNNLAVIHDSIDDMFFATDEDKVREFIRRHRLKGTIVLYAGSLFYHKGIDIFMELIIRLKSEGDKFSFIISGWGNIDYYKRYLRARGVENVLFLPGTDNRDMPVVYGAADILAHPVRFPGFTLVALEAMAQGKPVVAAATEGIDEIIEHNKSGYLIDIQDLDGWASKMKELAENGEKREKIGESGRLTAVKFRENAIKEEILKIYTNLDRR